MRGPELRFRLHASIDRLDREVRNLRASRELDSTKTTELALERERLLRNLAEVYLPELGRRTIDELQHRLPGVHRRLAAVLRAKQEERQQLDAARDAHGIERTESVTRLDGLTDRIEELAVERDSLAGRVSEALAADPRHADLVRLVQQAALRREQSERRHQAAVLEREEKIPEYEADRLFAYLLRRGYGTQDYRPSGLTRRLDGWIANKVDFMRQLESYNFLLEVPRVAQDGLKEDDRALEQARSRVRELEKSIEDLHGLTRVIEQGHELYEQRQAVVDRIEKIDREVARATERLKQLESKRGQYYEDAREALSDFLESHPIPRLRQIALATETRRDDRLATDLERWEDEWAAVRQRLAALEQKEQAIATRLDELRKIENRFRRKDYDASNSTFAQAFDFDGLLDRFLAGAVTASALWRAIVGSQRFEPTRYQKAAPVLEAILWEVVRQAAGGGWSRGRGGGGWRRGGWGGGTTGGFGGFGGGSRTTGGFG